MPAAHSCKQCSAPAAGLPAAAAGRPDTALSLQVDEAYDPWQTLEESCPPAPPPRFLPLGACQAALCQADSQCREHHLCCYNGCVYTCTKAIPPPPGRRPRPGNRAAAVGEGGRGTQVKCPALPCPVVPAGRTQMGLNVGHLGGFPCEPGTLRLTEQASSWVQ